MPWLHQGTRKYFYRARRINGRILRQYLGSGPLAEQAAAEIEQCRAQRRADAQLAREETLRHEEASAPLAELCRLTDLLMRAALISQGYHQHCRGAWRRRRVRQNESDTR
jgi:hypothetical protein